MVMPASRMLSAISLGVFCRSAPSTSAIMRSRNDEPAGDVMRTTIQSETTVVPPVTAERSPPASRITGADSPVTAASLTEAMPSMMSPSPGTRSPASTSTRSPGRRSRAETFAYCVRSAAVASRFAIVSVRVRRRASAWARPRPSAIASAKLANSTVNHSHTAIWPVNNACPPVARSRMNSTVTRRDTTAVTKITGLRISWRGSSLTKASSAARLTRAGSVAALA